MRRLLAPLLVALSLALLALACQSPPAADAGVPDAASSPAPKMGATFSNAPTFSTAEGPDGGTVTVAFSTFVTSLWAGPGTITIQQNGPNFYPSCSYGFVATDGGLIDAHAPEAGYVDAGYLDVSNAPCQDAAAVQTIVVPSGDTYSLAVPVLQSGAIGLADNTVITFSTGQPYVLTFSTY